MQESNAQLTISDNEFENFYAQKLAPLMPTVKAECKAADTWGMIGITSFVATVIIAFMGMEMEIVPHYIPIIIAGGLFCIGCYVQYIKKNDRFTDDYKGTVISEIIKHVDADITYKPGQCIPEQDYINSSLIRYYYDTYYGDDYMEGVYKGVPFYCSEIHTSFEEKGSVFNGFFFVAIINSYYSSGTYLWNKNNEQLAGSIYDEEYRLMPMPAVGRLAGSNSAFNNYFSVCTTNASLASMILTPERQQKIAEIQEQLQSLISFSFVGGKCYVAIASAENLLDPSKYEVDDKQQLKLYFRTVQSILFLIDELELDQLV